MPLNILVPTDGSPSAEKALVEALGLARKLGGKVSVVNVIEPLSWTVASPESIVFEKKMSEYQKSVLKRAAAIAKQQKVRISSHGLVGNVAEQILSFAKKGRFGLVVLGNRGLSDVDRFLLGSVSDRVAHHSACSVLVVK